MAWQLPGYFSIEVNVPFISLTSLLRSNGFLDCPVIVLLRSRVLTFIRGKSPRILTIADWDLKLKRGDVLLVPKSLPERYKDKLNELKSTDFRNYGAVFLPDDEMRMDKDLIRTRPMTTLVDLGKNSSPINNLETFFKALSEGPWVTYPIRNLIIVAHADKNGLWSIDPLSPMGRVVMDESVSSVTLLPEVSLRDVITDYVITYEVLKKIDENGRIKLSPFLFSPRPKSSDGKPIPAALHIKGCNLGKAEPFLLLLHKILGRGIYITAPKYLYLSTKHWTLPGYIECMQYEFSVRRPNQFRKRQEAIDEFCHKEFVLFDGSKVPDSNWSDLEWIPKGNLGMEKRYLDEKSIRDPVSRVVGLGTKTFTWNNYAEFRHKVNRQFGKDGLKISRSKLEELQFTQTEIQSMKLKTGEALCKDAVKRFLKKPNEIDTVISKWDPEHDFSMYSRLGFESLDDFIQSCKWTFSWKEDSLWCKAVYHEYTVVRTILNPKNREVILNFYPSSQEYKHRRLKPYIGMRVGDKKFFKVIEPLDSNAELGFELSLPDIEIVDIDE